jgi:RNA-directed DNA polymerase
MGVASRCPGRRQSSGGGRGALRANRPRRRPLPSVQPKRPVSGNGGWSVTPGFGHVHSHGGSPGLEGLPVEALAPALKAHGPRVMQAWLDGTSQPHPVQRVAGPKPPGGLRTLGVPPVVDRVSPHAGLQGLQAPGAPPCWASRGGVRPGRMAHHARKRAPASRQAGDPGGVAMAPAPGFDRVHHNPVRSAVATRVRGQRGVPRSHRRRKAGARAPEARQETGDGGPHSA